MKISIICLIGLLAASEVVPNSVIDPVTRLGAVTVLGVALLYLISKTIPKMVKEFRESLEGICQRHDKWEQIRHEDSQRMERLIAGLEKKE